jgi:hypothetical protein
MTSLKSIRSTEYIVSLLTFDLIFIISRSNPRGIDMEVIWKYSSA